MTSLLKKPVEENKIDEILSQIAQIIYKCKFCDFISDEKLLLITHYRSIHVKPVTASNCQLTDQPSELEERYVCSLCFTVFTSRQSVKEHMITDHGCIPMVNESSHQLVSERSVKNDEVNNKRDADKDLHRPISLRELQLKLKSSFVIKCTIKGCSKRFESEESKSYHERCHTLINNEFKCFECQATAKTWRNCSAHLYKHHKIDVDLLKCIFCSYKAGLCVQIFRHLQVHGATKGFACSNCPKVFKQFSQLRVHGITHHQNDSTQMRWYSQKKCEICHNTFANSKVLSKHIKTVHNQIKPFICNVCGHKSARKVTHMIHMRQHTGEKPISCQHCEFKAADPSVVKKHELRHQTKEQWKYKCNDCEYTSIQSSALKSHLKKYHPNSYKAIQCDECSFVSLNVNVLNRHKQSHKFEKLAVPDASSNNSEHTHQKRHKLVNDKPKRIFEVSSDCFLPLESTDSISHDPLLDTGGVTITENHIDSHTDETQFPNFSSD